jgi:hypothetical protein
LAGVVGLLVGFLCYSVGFHAKGVAQANDCYGGSWPVAKEGKRMEGNGQWQFHQQFS